MSCLHPLARRPGQGDWFPVQTELVEVLQGPGCVHPPEGRSGVYIFILPPSKRKYKGEEVKKTEEKRKLSTYIGGKNIIFEES